MLSFAFLSFIAQSRSHNHCRPERWYRVTTQHRQTARLHMIRAPGREVKVMKGYLNLFSITMQGYYLLLEYSTYRLNQKVIYSQ